MSARPHILVLMTDQQRADCLSCAGHPVIATPHMDRLAAEGVRFSNAYTTSPICMPARSTFLSGLYCHNHGQWNNQGRLPAGADTFLHRVKAAGYHTCHVGKSHLYVHRRGTHLNEELPFMRSLGWDDVLETTGPWATLTVDSMMTDHWQRIGWLETFRKDYEERFKVRPAGDTWPSPMPAGETLDDFVGRTAVEYVENYDGAAPLVLFVGFGGPHHPWDPPAEWAGRYDPSAMPAMLPMTEPGEWVPSAAARFQRELQSGKHGISEELGSKIRALYYAKISHIDWWFGRIMEAFEGRGFWDDTAVIFWSDHGEMLGDKGRVAKGVFYDQSAKVPLVVRLPDGRGAGSVAPGLVSLVDGFPTILEMAGCEPKAECFGKSLVPLLADPEARVHDAVFSEIDNRTMVRDERFKMVVDSGGEVLKLYDMTEDPTESVNLVGRRGTARTVAGLRDRMLAWYLGTQTRQGD